MKHLERKALKPTFVFQFIIQYFDYNIWNIIYHWRWTTIKGNNNIREHIRNTDTDEINTMPTSAIPTVDLSPFFTAGDDESCRKKCKDLIAEACSDYGFFQIVNHGVPLDLINQAMELSKTFFNYNDEVKRECSSSPDSPLPAGYNKQPDHSPDKNEYLLMFPPESPFNVLPTNPPDFR